MNDVKMMLGKRAAQYYLFATWCIIAPILMLVSDHHSLNIAKSSFISTDNHIFQTDHSETIGK